MADAISQQLRKKTATFGGDRFPMPDVKHARLALQDLPKAKNISGSEASQVRARANRMLAAQKSLGRG
jgi:hypothetical protein